MSPLLAPLTLDDPDAGTPETEAAGAAVLQAFGVDAQAPACERSVRVVGALGALAVLTLAARQQDPTTAWRPLIVATCFDALGHSAAGALPLLSDQVEA